MADHDNGYKRLFSHPEMIADLLRGLAREELARDPDFSTLEKVSASYVIPKPRSHEGSVVWRVRRESDRGFYVDLLIECKPTIDLEMSLRVRVYVGLDAPWSASWESTELTEPTSDGLEPNRSRLCCCLLDETRIAVPELKPLQNLAVILLQLEKSQDLQDIQRGLAALIEWRREHDTLELRRSFIQWLRGVLLPARVSPVDLFEQGRQEGLQEGQEHALDKARRTLVRDLEKRFGPLPESIRGRIDSIVSIEDLTEFTLRAGAAASLAALADDQG